VASVWLVSIERNSNKTTSRALLLGVAMGIATAILWAVSITIMNLAVNYNRQLDSALAINIIRVIAMGVTFAAFTPFLYRSHRLTMVSWKTVVFLIVGGLVALGLGWFFLSYSLTVTEESRTVPISSVTPLFSTLIAVLMFHEKVVMKNALGSVMIVIGLFIIFLL
jgi:transporter family protein